MDDLAKGIKGRCMTDITAAGEDSAKLKNAMCTAGQSCNTMIQAELYFMILFQS